MRGLARRASHPKDREVSAYIDCSSRRCTDVTESTAYLCNKGRTMFAERAKRRYEVECTMTSRLTFPSPRTASLAGDLGSVDRQARGACSSHDQSRARVNPGRQFGKLRMFPRRALVCEIVRADLRLRRNKAPSISAPTPVATHIYIQMGGENRSRWLSPRRYYLLLPTRRTLPGVCLEAEDYFLLFFQPRVPVP